MIKITLILALSVGLSYAQTTQELIEIALKNSPTLGSAKARLVQSQSLREISRNFDNPSLQLLVNDIQTQDISNRSIEPMQFTTLAFSQKLPFLGKRDARYEDSQAQEASFEFNLKQSQAVLINEIKQEAYRIWQLREEQRIYVDFELLVRQNAELYTALSSVASRRHMGIMSSQMDLSQIKITQANLSEELERSYATLSQLCGQKVDTVEIALPMGNIESIGLYEEALKHNFGYRAKEAQLQAAHAQLKQAKLDYYPDVTIQMGYSRRESFNDYWSAGINIPLPIYGTESVKEQIGQAKVQERNHDKEATYLQLESSMRQKYAQMHKTLEVWNVVHDESLPQLNHMFELTEASIRNGEDLFRFTEILKQKLQLELQQSRAVSGFYSARAQLDLLVGKEQ